MRSIRVLLCIRVGDCLVECAPHGHMIRQICRQPPVEVRRARLQVGREASILHRQVIVLFFVHLFVHDILLGDTQRATGAALVYLRRPPSRFHTRFEASITPSRSGDIRSTQRSATCTRTVTQTSAPFLVLFMCPFRLDGLCRRDGALRRHDQSNAVTKALEVDDNLVTRGDSEVKRSI